MNKSLSEMTEEELVALRNEQVKKYGEFMQNPGLWTLPPAQHIDALNKKEEELGIPAIDEALAALGYWWKS